MTKRFFGILCAALAVITLTVVSTSAHSVSAKSSASDKIAVVGAVAENALPETEKILEARFLNMLNHSYAYDGDFDSVEALVNQSVTALLSVRDAENEAYISEAAVFDYLFNMYGVEIADFSEINAGFPKKEGYVYIIPRGYAQLTHTAESITENEDGSFTFKTSVKIEAHDGEPYFDTCETLFVKNEESSFGFNIISSVIGAEAAAV